VLSASLVVRTAHLVVRSNAYARLDKVVRADLNCRFPDGNALSDGSTLWTSFTPNYRVLSTVLAGLRRARARISRPGRGPPRVVEVCLSTLWALRPQPCTDQCQA
jgi:hypothetical protein